jgi:hypothetical protein
MERYARAEASKTKLFSEEWGEKPTTDFFKQAQSSRRSGGIDRLRRHTVDDNGKLVSINANGEPVDVGTESVIDSVDDPDGSGAKRIADSLAAFWQHIYQRTTSERTPLKRVRDDYPEGMRLTPSEKEKLGADFTVNDIKTAIKKLATNRSTFGVVAEVFKGATLEIAPLLMTQLNYARQTGGLTAGQRQGRLSLLYKKGERLDAANYRPVAILRADFKIAALVLTGRLTPHLATVTEPTQTGFVNGRYIHENCLRLRDGMKHAADVDADAVVLSTDFEKAYDLVQHAVLFEVASTVGGDGYATQPTVRMPERQVLEAAWGGSARASTPASLRSTRPGCAEP